MPAKSKSQQRFFGMVRACQKKGICASKEIKKVADDISKKDAEDFASTKHKGLPNKVRKKKSSSRFSEWLIERAKKDCITKESTLSSGTTGGTGDIETFKRTIGPGIIRRKYPFLDQNQDEKGAKRA